MFSTGLTRFFHNGKDIRRDAISLIISKIKSLLHWFESQNQLHFYASSLLLVYEGSPHRVNGTKHRRVETESQYNHRTHSQLYSSLSKWNINGTCEGSVEKDSENIGMNHQFGLEEGVEVKMIDFAHVFPSDGPDESYMYGLRNLLSNLEQILMD